jgi:15-cis-phytoene synthase
MTPDAYCLSRVGGAGTSLHYSLLFTAPAQRRAVIAVYAFMHEVGEIVDEIQDPGVAQTKLAWWHEELARLYSGQARHPATKALALVVSDYRLEQQRFLDVLHETADAFAHTRYADFESLYAHCRHTGGVTAQLTAAILGSTDDPTRRYAETLGAALRLTDILSGVGQDIRRERIYLPAEDLRRFGVTDTDLLARRHSAAFEELMQFEVTRNLEYYERALGELPGAEHPKQLPGVILANLAQAQLGEVRRDQYHVLDHRVALTPLRKLWIAWRTRLTEP